VLVTEVPIAAGDCFWPHRYDVDAIARMQLERLRESTAAAELAKAALQHVAEQVLERPFGEDSSGGFASLAGALTLFDVDAALDLADRASRSQTQSAALQPKVLAGIAARLAPVDPEAAWALAAVTPEVAGSSPVAPAKGLQAASRCPLTRAERDLSSTQARGGGRIGFRPPSRFHLS
jgi:hypothetical protein